MNENGESKEYGSNEFEFEDIYHIEPGGKAEPLPLRAKVPGGVQSLNRRAVIVLLSVLGFFVATVSIYALRPRDVEKKPYEPRPGDVTPSELVRALPSDYSKLPKPKPEAEPIRARLADAPSPVERPREDLLAKYLEEERLKRLKRAEEARNGDILFQGVSVPEQKAGAGVNGGGAGGFGTDPFSALGSQAPSLSAQSGNSRDQANRQDDKLSFLADKKKSDTLLLKQLENQPSPYTLQAGSIIPGLLLTGINSDLPGQISGQVSQNVYDSVTGAALLLPQGTKVIGQYDSRVTYGQERVLIVWTRLLLPNGKSISLEGMPGVDLSGYTGLTDQVNNHYFKLATGVLFGSLLGAAAQMAQGSNNNINPSYGQLAMEGVAENTNQVGQEITRKNLDIQPTIEIRPGFRFNIFVTKDIVLEPYAAV